MLEPQNPMTPRTKRSRRSRRRTARRNARAEGEKRNVLARVIAAEPRRVAAVVGGNDREIALAEARLERRQTSVEPLERARVSARVAAVTRESVGVV